MKKILGLVLGILLTINLISGFNGYSSPMDFLDSEWINFVLIFVFLFAIVYFAVNKATDNSMISCVIAGALGLLITIAFAQKGWLYGFFGESTGGWLIVFAVIITTIALFKVLIDYMGVGPGIFAGLLVMFSFYMIIDIWEIFPDSPILEPLEFVSELILDLGMLGGSIFFIGFIIYLLYQIFRSGRKGLIIPLIITIIFGILYLFGGDIWEEIPLSYIIIFMVLAILFLGRKKGGKFALRKTGIGTRLEARKRFKKMKQERKIQERMLKKQGDILRQ